MTFNQLEDFVAVAEAGSFSQAAKKLFLSPQALIQKIARMEQELGFVLLVRSSKGVYVSAAGQVFYQSAKRILAEYRSGIERAMRQAKQASTLRIGLPEGVNPAFLLSVCRTFSKAYPDILLHYDRLSRQDTVKALLKDKLDIAAQIRSHEETPYESVKLFPVTYYCLILPDSPLAQKSCISLEDLNGSVIGLWGPLQAYRMLSQHIANLGLDIQLHSIPEDLSETLVFCMAGHPLLASVPVINYLKATLAVVPVSFDTGQSYYLAYTQKGSKTIEDFIGIAQKAASSEAHPWKQTLSGMKF